jgi:hypothetical protein
LRAGEVVTFIDIRPDHVEEMKVERGGLQQDPRHIADLRLN